MKDRLSSVVGPFVGPDGTFVWPNDEAARNKLASDIFGALVVADMDSWLESALEALRNRTASSEWRRSHTQWESNQKFREGLAALTPEQRALVEGLLFSTVEGVVFSILAHLDQFPSGQLELNVLDVNAGRHLASVNRGSILDLHDRLLGWVEALSEYSREFRKTAG
jgi:hypothetical protein